MLVGGLSESPYVWNRIKEWCEAKNARPICPERSSVISKICAVRMLISGCVVGVQLSVVLVYFLLFFFRDLSLIYVALRGLQGPIVARRICSRHYGIMIARPFKPDLEVRDDRVFNHQFWNREYRAGWMKWHIKKVQCSVTIFARLLSSNLPRVTGV